MPSDIFKEPTRKRNYSNKTALIHYARQYKYTETKSRLYMDTVFHRHGPDRLFVATLSALTEAIKFFNDTYGDTLHIRHGVLLLTIKQAILLNQTDYFTSKDIENNFPHVVPFIASFTTFDFGKKILGRILRDLVTLQFINPTTPNGKKYRPSMRLKVFCTTFDKKIKKYFEN